MANILNTTDLTPGGSITGAQLNLDATVQSTLNLLGLTVSRPAALIIVAAGLFFVGVMIASFVRNGDGRRCTLVSSPMSFLISSIVWVPLLNSKTIGVKFAPIDSFCAWVHGLDPTLGTLVSWGIVMALGSLSCVIYTSVTALGGAFVSLIQRNATPPATPTPPQAGV